LFRPQQPGIDHLLHFAVVCRQLAQLTVPPAIEPAVAGPQSDEFLAFGKQNDNRAGDDGVRTELESARPERMIYRVKLAGSRLGKIFEIGRRLDRAQGSGDAGAREIARLMTAHAIGDGPDTEIRSVKKRILVALAHESDMGQPMRGKAERSHRTGL